MIKKFLLLSFILLSNSYSGGYKLPEQSLNATALSAAYIANASGADASYYNPSNMVFNSRGNELDFTLTYIHLPKIDFNTSSVGLSGDSKTEDFLIPTLHYIIPTSSENIQYGLSLVAPGGLSKRWDEPGQRASSEKFSLRTIEINPSVGYKVTSTFSIGGGLRVLHSSGVVKSTAAVSRDMEGEAIEFGYNLAMTYRPSPDTTVAVTYRSNIDMNLQGNAKLYLGNSLAYNGGGSVKVPLPASLDIALAKTIEDVTLEFVLERTYWSKYQSLDFEYDSAISNPTLKAYFDDPKVKNYKDSNTYRIGATYKYSKRLSIMAGYAYDETPVPNSTIGFELPDSSANIYSLGFKYKLNKNSSFGMAYLLSDKKDRDVSIDIGGVDTLGRFSNSQAKLLSLGFNHTF